MEYRYMPRGVCSTEMIFDIENGIIKKAKIIGGCAGNTVGLTNLKISITENNQNPQYGFSVYL